MLTADELDEIERRTYGEPPAPDAKDAQGYMRHFVALAATAVSSSVSGDYKGQCQTLLFTLLSYDCQLQLIALQTEFF